MNRLVQYEEVFSGMMVAEELGGGLLAGEPEDEGYLIRDAFVMGMSFLGGGALPLLVLLVGALPSLPPRPPPLTHEY